MNWIELVIIGSFLFILIAIARRKKHTGGSCCSEGMDGDNGDSHD
jgi:hypothetical protein